MHSDEKNTRRFYTTCNAVCGLELVLNKANLLDMKLKQQHNDLVLGTTTLGNSVQNGRTHLLCTANSIRTLL
jgi:hypothetical protein